MEKVLNHFHTCVNTSCNEYNRIFVTQRYRFACRRTCFALVSWEMLWYLNNTCHRLISCREQLPNDLSIKSCQSVKLAIMLFLFWTGWCLWEMQSYVIAVRVTREEFFLISHQCDWEPTDSWTPRIIEITGSIYTIFILYRTPLLIIPWYYNLVLLMCYTIKQSVTKTGMPLWLSSLVSMCEINYKIFKGIV